MWVKKNNTLMKCHTIYFRTLRHTKIRILCFEGYNNYRIETNISMATSVYDIVQKELAEKGDEAYIDLNLIYEQLSIKSKERD